ncbi:hypothetical protein [Tautonia sociabilis]|uniref:Uncharacterized protein n=1 Tax=Tautonia sociabilis TaxID=2080755 RepID=A0A432MNU8_9BACT|nr:hypothetical protein [Tautonia sociabilis]RUL89123.1 hypothetical protein TsocGM_03120 [Tautonia sociabilis]
MNAFLLAVVAIAAQHGETDTHREFLEAIRIAYESNLAKMPFATIEMIHVDGSAETLEDARAGRIDDPIEAKCTYRFHGDDRLYLRTFDLADMDRTSVELPANRTAIRVSSSRALTDGERTIVEYTSGSTSSGVGMHNGVGPFREASDIPLDLGLPEELRGGLGLSLRRVLDDDGTKYWINEVVEDDGQGIARIEIGFPEGTVTYWVDLERGCIPIRSLSDAKGSRVEDSFEDIRLVDGVAYYPFVSTTHFSGKVQQNRVTAMDLTTPPPPDSFQLEFPRERSIINGDTDVTYPARKVWRLASLPSADSPAVTRFPSASSAAPPPQAGEREPGPSSKVLLAAAAAVLLAVATGLAWLRRRG